MQERKRTWPRLEPDFTDEEPLHDPLAAMGPSSSYDDEVAEGDEALRDAILTELHEDPATTALDISVHVRNAIAYLRGRVDDLDEAESAEEVARRVPGVKDVLEDLEVVGL